jgi:hypothetical protein
LAQLVKDKRVMYECTEAQKSRVVVRPGWWLQRSLCSVAIVQTDLHQLPELSTVSIPALGLTCVPRNQSPLSLS